MIAVDPGVFLMLLIASLFAVCGLGWAAMVALYRLAQKLGWAK